MRLTSIGCSSLFSGFLSILIGCSHAAKTEAAKEAPPVDPASFAEHFKSMKDNGVRSLTCRVTFPPNSYLAKMLEGEGKITKAEASLISDQPYKVIAFTDGSSCFIQGKTRPQVKNPEVNKEIEHFADVASAAIHGSCQMFELGYLRTPLDFTKASTLWKKELDGSWSVRTADGGGQTIVVGPDLRKIDIYKDNVPQPFTIEYSTLEAFRVPVKVSGMLEGQGGMIYSANYATQKGKPVPLTTQLQVTKPGKDPIRMTLEYADCEID